MPGAGVKKEPPHGALANGPSLRPATRNGGQKRSASYLQAPDSPSLDSIGAADGKKPNIPGFLTKTFEIFSNDEYTDLCGWGENGDTIVIKKVPEFSSTVLPKYFKHSNFQSFVRQLNMYDFHKTVQDPSHGEFKHEFFKRGRGDLLCKIKRKVSQPVNSNKSNGELMVTTTAIAPMTVVASASPAQGIHTLANGAIPPVITLPTANGNHVTETPTLGNKAWQRRVEQRLNGLEDANRALLQENQVLYHHWQSQGQQLRTLKDCLVRLVGTMNEYTGGSIPAIQRLRTDLEHHLMPAPSPQIGPNGLPAVPVVTNGAPALPPPPPETTTTNEAVPNGEAPAPSVGEVNGGQELSRTLSVEPFWRGQSLNSLPSFGGLDLDFSLSPDSLFGRLNSSTGFGRLQSLERLGSTERAAKRSKYGHAEAQALQDQLEALKRNQASNFQRIDSLEQQLTSLFDEGELIDLDDHEGPGVEGEEGVAAVPGAASEPMVDGVNVKAEVGGLPTSYGLPVSLEASPPTAVFSSAPTAFMATAQVPPAPALAGFPPGPMEGGALVKQQAYHMVPSTPYPVAPVPAQESL